MLARLANLAARPEAKISFETITMPKRKFGHRPVLITDTPARVLFAALVDSIDKDLEPDSRAEGAWEIHEKFAEESSSEYIVDIDIAACYEFIDHERLHEELLVRTMDVDKADAIGSFLTRCSFKGRGIPQLSSPSDRLADLYLSVLRRQLMRHALEVSRFADDFRVRADNWESATETIELAAEYARDLGLILSSDKTQITRTEKYKARVQAQKDLQELYFDSAKSSLTFIQMVSNRYEDERYVEIPPDDKRAFIASMQRIIHDWRMLVAGATPDSRTGSEVALQKILPIAISSLQGEARVEAQFFADLIYREPVRLEAVCKYILGRLGSFSETEENWSLLRKIVDTGRVGPWARIWLLHVAGQLEDPKSEDSAWVIDWVKKQCSDRHETVRAEAAWASAKFGGLTNEVAVALLKASTPLTQSGIAAAMGCQGGLNAALVKSVIQERVPINRESYEWGEAN
ncbi:reverse transcriptase domain-containing protein [Streptomyces sp. NPDC057235]|uniref:reverse transcriptase domain-containing protein n=1 Tax=Streptomyces sp. NPDC057235 TaxID=3346058 RepID=UPI00363AD86A